MADSRDANGNYCGRNVKTGKFTESPLELCGYCGPECLHCVDRPYYVVDNGVWVCAADYNYED